MGFETAEIAKNRRLRRASWGLRPQTPRTDCTPPYAYPPLTPNLATRETAKNEKKGTRAE